MAAFWTSRVCAPWRRCISQTKAARRCPEVDNMISEEVEDSGRPVQLCARAALFGTGTPVTTIPAAVTRTTSTSTAATGFSSGSESLGQAPGPI